MNTTTINLRRGVRMCTLFILFNLRGYAQGTSDLNLYKLCKVWGYMKYFHTEVSSCKVNWDSTLIATIPAAKNAQSNANLDLVLSAMISSAGPMALPTVPLPPVDSTLIINYDLSWIHNLGFGQSVVDMLDDIQDKFRPVTNCYVRYSNYMVDINKGYLVLDDTVSFANASYPDEPHRLLVAFRYWNIIRYFNPNNNIIDVPWDSTLLEFIPRFVQSANQTDYHLLMLEFIARINDTHAAFTGSTVIANYFGNYLPNFKIETIENKLVVTNISGASALQVGDVLTAINGISTDTIRQQLVKYIPHSNPGALNRDRNVLMLRGVASSTMNLSITRGGIAMSAQSVRSLSRSSYFNNVYYVNRKLPKALTYPEHNAGYMNLENIGDENYLQGIFDSVGVFDKLIIDLRNYPDYSVAYASFFTEISDDRRPFCLLTKPSVTFPGMLSNISTSLYGSASASNTYAGKIYVLVDENTQSASEFSAMALQSLPNVAVVGTQTAGADGNVTFISLPGGFYSYFTTLQPRYPDGTIAQRVGVRLDVPVVRTVQGVLNGKDEILEKALSMPTGSTEVKPESAGIVSLFPNPSSGIVHLRLAKSSSLPCNIELFDITGKKVFYLNATAEQGQLTLDVGILPKGMYLLKLHAGESTATRKVVID